ncbi:MAG: ATP-dependent Clp protease adaptor ClpS [Dehalococcoidia bacterium]
MTMPAPEVETRPDIETRPLILPPYAVILHNDDHNEMAYVVRSILTCVPEVTPDQAVQIMLEAHEHGRALVIVCPLERAELYRDRLESRGLTATIEKA